MTTTLEVRYEKNLRLPHSGSHTYALTVRTEVSDTGQIDLESQRLHALLQAAVDREIQTTGYLPSENEPNPAHGTNGHRPPLPEESSGVGWQCSGRQRELILTIAEERQLALTRVEALAKEHFGKELRQLSRSQASRIITRLLTE